MTGDQENWLCELCHSSADVETVLGDSPCMENSSTEPKDKDIYWLLKLPYTQDAIEKFRKREPSRLTVPISKRGFCEIGTMPLGPVSAAGLCR